MNIKKIQTHVTLCSLLAVALWCGGARSDALLELKMDVYSNVAGERSDGRFCDFFSACDHYFRFSIDKADGSQTDAKSGFYYSIQTGTFQNMDSDYFNGDMNGVNNPLLVDFPLWPGTVLFKVYVQDDDSPLPADYVDSIIQTFSLVPQTGAATASFTPVLLRGMRSSNPTSLTMEYRLYCAATFFGPNCSVVCVGADNSNGHFTCNPTTGAPVCLPGWQQDVTSKCLTAVNPCSGSLCQNGTCVPGVTGTNSYTCNCFPGYAGSTCAVSVNVACPAGYAGSACDVRICNFINCQNGGTCINGACQCPIGFSGSNCELSYVCATRPCLNYGTCVNAPYRCDCLSGYGGVNCSLPSSDNAANTTFDLYYQPQIGTASVFSTPQGGPLVIALIVLLLALLIVAVVLGLLLIRWRRRALAAEHECSFITRGSASSVVTDSRSNLSQNVYQSKGFQGISNVSTGANSTDKLSPGPGSPGFPYCNDSDYAALDCVALEEKGGWEGHLKKEVTPKLPPARLQGYKMMDDNGEPLEENGLSKC